MSQEFKGYNKIYAENEITFGAGRPERVVSDILKLRSRGSVLELGAGEGRNALFLAQNGFEVIAQDLSEVGIHKIKKQAAEKNLSIQAEVSDCRTLELDKNFDAVVSTFMLHHLSREEALKVIKQIQAHTNVGGLNAITVFTKNGDFYKNNPDADNFYPTENELKDLYGGWEIEEYEEIESQALAKRPDGTPMLNVAANLLARKLK